MSKKKKYSAVFKTKVALSAIREEGTLSELSARYGINANMISKWKKQALDNMNNAFSGKYEKSEVSNEHQVKQLHAKIGELTVEKDFLQRCIRKTRKEWRLEMIKSNQDKLSISKQCELLQVARSSCYYNPKGESAENLELMKKIDEIYLKHPFYGSRQMSVHLKKEGEFASRHKIRRLMKLMGISAVYQKPNTSKKNIEHKIYPYLLRDKVISKANEVWCTDITYITMNKGFMYLVAIMDWASRKVLSWRLSNTLDTSFCLDALEEALSVYGKPDIFNTDQGSQFTSNDFTNILKNHDIQISMDGKGCWIDNVFIERLWRSIKYECIYLQEFDNVGQLREAIANWLEFYNKNRPHSTFAGLTPEEVYYRDNSNGSMPKDNKFAA